jgi:hypothetical protein
VGSTCSLFFPAPQLPSTVSPPSLPSHITVSVISLSNMSYASDVVVRTPVLNVHNLHDTHHPSFPPARRYCRGECPHRTDSTQGRSCCRYPLRPYCECCLSFPTRASGLITLQGRQILEIQFDRGEYIHAPYVCSLDPFPSHVPYA